MIALVRRARRLAGSRAGNALIEFGLGLPVMLAAGAYGMETCNEVFTQMKVSQIALMLADNASRVGAANGQAVFQLREGDIGDVLQGARLTGTGLQLTTFGRITLSSLENVQQTYSDHASDTSYELRVHWQRCIGKKTGPGYDSSYGPVALPTTSGSDSSYANRGLATTGLGAAPVVTAPQGSGVMFVELNYLYQPLFGTMYVSGPKIIHSVASFVVRDKRDFTQIYNPVSALGTKATPATCDLHNS